MFEEGLATMANHQDISKNCQKLFNYLLCLGKNPNAKSALDSRNNRRIFSHSEVNLQKISRTIHLSVPTLKKYWFLLEEAGKVRYGGEFDYDDPEEKKREEIIKEKYKEKKYYELTEKEKFEVWKKLWTYRKSKPNIKYVTYAGNEYRCIPQETLEWLSDNIYIDEQTMKIYQFLLSYREVGAQGIAYKLPFSLQDIRNFLGKTNNVSNNKVIMESLFWLKYYELIFIQDSFYINSKGAKIASFNLINVEFYPNFNKPKKIEESEESLISEDTLNKMNEWVQYHKNMG